MSYTEAMEILNLISSDGGIEQIRHRIASAGADELNAVSKRKRNTPLHLAAIKGRTDTIALLLDAGAAIEPKNKESNTPLHLAARFGHTDCIFELLKAGADPDGPYPARSRPPLYYAAHNGHARCFALLWHAGATVPSSMRHLFAGLPVIPGYARQTATVPSSMNNLLAEFSKRREDLLARTRKLDGDMGMLEEALGDAGMNLNLADEEGNTALHHAVKEYKTSGMASTLIKLGADVNARDSDENTPLHTATRRGDFDLVQLLLNAGADANALNKNDESPFHMVLSRGDNDRDIHGNTLWHTDARLRRQVRLVHLLLDASADANILTKQGDSPLLIAVARKNLDCTRILLPLTSEANINGYDGKGNTPLSIAADRGDDETVRLLLNAGADPNLSSHPETHGTPKNPLNASISCYQVKTATTLLQYGALPDSPAYDALAGLYAGADGVKLRLLPERRELLEIMLHFGMDPSQTISQQGSACGDTLLHVMCRHDAPIEEILKLLEYDRNALNKKNADGDTPLASHIGGKELRIGVVRTLLEYGADAAVSNNKGLSLLSLLDKRPVVEVTNRVREVLIDNGADDLAQSWPPQAEQAPTSPNTRHGAA